MKHGSKFFGWRRCAAPRIILAGLLGFVFTACNDRDDSAAGPPNREFSRRTAEFGDGSPVRESAQTLRASEDILPGASDVRSSLERGDYSEAVDSLLALRSASTEGRRYTEYLTLYSEVADTLRAQARSDEKAAGALERFEALAHRK